MLLFQNRLRDEFGLDVFFGAMRIAFRETVTDLTPIQVEEHFSAGENVGSARQELLCTAVPLRLRPHVLEVDLSGCENVSSFNVGFWVCIFGITV